MSKRAEHCGLSRAGWETFRSPSLQPQRLLEQLEETLPGTWVADSIGISTVSSPGYKPLEGRLL